MSLKDRIKEYKEIDKGPLRTLLKIKIGDSIAFSHLNGICACDDSVDAASIGKVVEKGKFTIVQLKREYMPSNVIKSEESLE